MSKRVLTRDEEMEIAIAYLGKVPIAAISSYYNLSRSGIRRVLGRLGIETNRGKRSSR